jgi:hypothetical protein
MIGNPVFSRAQGHNLQAALAEATELIWRGAGFVGTAAQHRRPGGARHLRRLQKLFLALDRAWPGDDHDLVTTERHRADAESRIRGVEIARGEFVLLRDAQGLLDTRQNFQRLLQLLGDRHADHADDRLILPERDLRAQPRIADHLRDPLQLFLCETTPHDDDHGNKAPLMTNDE